MKPIPFVTNDSQLFDRVKELIKTDQPDSPKTIQLKELQPAIDFLNIEIPELVFIDFADPQLEAQALLETMMGDPWLLHAGIIALTQDYATTERLEQTRGANIIVALKRDDVSEYLPRIMDIIHENRRILFQREIGLHLIPEISGSFKLRNDVFEAMCYKNLICNFLYNTNRIDLAKKNLLHLSLDEMLMNAIEHGNCGITYDAKTAWLEKNNNIMDFIKQKCQDPAIARRQVTFEYNIKPLSSTFFIADEGAGFDWRTVKDVTQDKNRMEKHGRGIIVTRSLTKNFIHNEKGNEVRFEIEHQSDTESTLPRIFKDIKPVEIKFGDIVFQEGEPGDFIYYIVKGQYDVIVNDKIISSLSPDDILMGEMSFLLSNWRSATIRARTDGRLIKVSKKELVESIKKNPHYALFLSRLLAQRIQRSNISSSQVGL